MDFDVHGHASSTRHATTSFDEETPRDCSLYAGSPIIGRIENIPEETFIIEVDADKPLTVPLTGVGWVINEVFVGNSKQDILQGCLEVEAEALITLSMLNLSPTPLVNLDVDVATLPALS